MFLVVAIAAKTDSGYETECCTSDLNLRIVAILKIARLLESESISRLKNGFESMLIQEPIAGLISTKDMLQIVFQKKILSPLFSKP